MEKTNSSEKASQTKVNEVEEQVCKTDWIVAVNSLVFAMSIAL